MSNLTTKVIAQLMRESGDRDRFVVELNTRLAAANHPFGQGFTNVVIQALKASCPAFKTMIETNTWTVTNGTANAIAAKLDNN